ncbi:MAG TPA: UvrD-helicase domain-containing protein [Saprospiraceae bacterium]|mgnify:CR=1 FL=1|nr:UvrD-helicase domain-containing protein [Saprospiraceae bacterium]HMP26155.1 UvrD-helicase domain-containing protein [Saprospiraceae bacterium]
MSTHFKIISAGAGSGKTYRLTSEMVQLLQNGVRANGIIATTFTTKAAAELQERVRVRLLEAGLTREADDLTNALIGTVHGMGVKLLQRFAFEAGVSPEVSIIADEDQQTLFNLSLAMVLTEARVLTMERLCDRLGLNKNDYFDWRREVKQLTDVARANDFSLAILEKSKMQSFARFQQFLSEPSEQPEAYFKTELQKWLEETITALSHNGDTTKKTADVVLQLKGLQRELELRGELYWHQWAKIAKLDVGVKSRDDITNLKDFAAKHDTIATFHDDIRDFIYTLFDIVTEALREYDAYKKQRGLIDYTDMEVLVKRLLENEGVQEVLREELDLLMVDEFQDTSPIQLEIFLKLSKLAKYSVWVGDPKQSIYGFRGAEPRLMQAIIDKMGGIQDENIQKHSWRSRTDIVFATNAIFTKAFHEIPAEQVALEPKRTKNADPIELNDALMHWHFIYDGDGRQPGKPWMENCIAQSLKQILDRGIRVLPKGEKNYRNAQPGDVAILCRSNAECQSIAEALHRAGLRAAISRSGLLNTAEAKLIFAGLKYLLNPYDSLSVAEILLLASGQDIEDIIEDRLDFLEKAEQQRTHSKWAENDAIIQKINILRLQAADLSSSEILNLLLEELDLRRIIAAWGNTQQRLDNVDVLRRLALQYEEACNRLHAAASLGGFLLWLNDLENNNLDMQGSGEGPDAVNVMTYHKSKGLEWPVVICHSLEGSLRAGIWGIDIMPETETVDLDNVLNNRWLRYWVNPYNDQYRHTPLEARIEESTAKAAKDEQALQEEARLLYVGLTRARDYLVLPTTAKPTKWLNRVWHEGQEDYPTLDHHSHETPWMWQAQVLTKQTEVFYYPKDFPQTAMTDQDVRFIEPRTGKKQHPTYTIDPDNEHFSQEMQAQPGAAYHYTAPIPLAEDADRYQVAKMLKASLIGFHRDYPPAEQTDLLEGFIQRYNLEKSLKINDLHHQMQAFFQALEQHFTIQTIHRKYPVRYFHQGRLFERILDFIIEIGHNEVIVIQNSGFAGDANKLKNKTLELSSFFYLSQLAVQDIFQVAQVRTFANFVLHSTLQEVAIRTLAPASGGTEQLELF